MKRTALASQSPKRLAAIAAGTYKPKKPKGFKRPDKKIKTKKRMSQRSATYEPWWPVAMHIWETEPHECAVCKCNLGDVPQPSFFSHLLPRSGYRNYRLDERNIVLKCQFHHDEWHNFGDKEKLVAHDERWYRTVQLYYGLRDEANGI